MPDLPPMALKGFVENQKLLHLGLRPYGSNMNFYKLFLFDEYVFTDSVIFREFKN